MAVTIYDIGGAFTTTEPDIAATYSRRGFRVTARTREGR